jgi:hypothetical protein
MGDKTLKFFDFSLQSGLQKSCAELKVFGVFPLSNNGLDFTICSFKSKVKIANCAVSLGSIKEFPPASS